ncbi:MAG: hypothetical protein J6J24_00210 [Clostridia bacterium]|nr:hypothetical protein [Clostridia bacterium]
MKFEDMKFLLEKYVEEGGEVETISKTYPSLYREIKNWTPMKDGRRLNMKEKFALLGFERKAQRATDVVENIKTKIAEFELSGGKIEELSSNDELYQYIKNVHIYGKDGKLLSMQQKLALAGEEKTPSYTQDTKKELIAEIEDYLANGGSFHIERKKLPFYERLRTYTRTFKSQNKIKREVTSDEVMKSLGYKNYSDLYFYWSDIADLSVFRDRDGYVDSYRKNAKVKNKVNDFATKLELPIAVVVGLIADEKLEKNFLGTDFLSYVKGQLKSYVNANGNMIGISHRDPELYERMRNLRRSILTETGEEVSMEDLVFLLEFEDVERNFSAKGKKNVDIDHDMRKLVDISLKNDGRLKRTDIPQHIYRDIVSKALSLGITTKAFFKSYDIDYVDGRDVDRFKHLAVKEYPYMREMKKRRDALLEQERISKENGCCKEEIFEKKVEIAMRVYDEFKDKIFANGIDKKREK